MLAPDTLLKDRYRVLKTLRPGGVGMVYQARDTMLDRIVAIKILSPALSGDESFIQRFQREAKMLAHLSHPAIVPIFDVGQEDNMPYLVMAYVEGQSLDDLLEKGTSIPPERAVQILEQVAAGLDYAHKRGLVHRDVKPGNILLDKEGKALITDFGLAKEKGTTLTLPGQVLGTPAYMAPEQIQGEQVGPWTDVYALGIVAYELLAGQLPFQGTMSVVFDGHLHREPPIPQVKPDVSSALAGPVRLALAKNAEARPASASAFVAALKQSLIDDRQTAALADQTKVTRRGEPANVPPAGPPTPPLSERAVAGPAAPTGRSRQRLVLVGAAAFILFCLCGLFGIAGLGLFSSSRATPAVAELADSAEIEAAADSVDDSELSSTVESRAVTNLQDVRKAVIRIEAQGTFIDPQFGLQLNRAGHGSGFIIDESGIAVTNNHVVTGAALLRVYIEGEDRPRNARVLGVSECSDLAVIEISGNDFHYLDWHEGSITVGQDIYAAGFPLGDPEYTLTRGVVSKARADGVTNWTAVDAVLEHDATINPGNSGGPLVDPDGRVIGVNYALSRATSQYLAIARNEAIPVIEQLRNGQDVHSIGVNGEAVTDGQSIFGIWVASVKSGSVTDRAGVRPGDIITAMEGLILASDGTMGDYCSILRSHSPDDTLTIHVVRDALQPTQHVLEGQLNGRTLVTLVPEEIVEHVSESSAGATYSGFTAVRDDSSSIVVEIPVEWRDVSTGGWIFDDEVIGVRLAAAADLDRFYDTWTEPGIFFGASRLLMQRYDPESLINLDRFDFSNSCRYDGRSNYSDSLYTGFYDVWLNCGGENTNLLTLTFMPQDQAFLGLIQIVIVSSADVDATKRILDTFQVIGNLP